MNRAMTKILTHTRMIIEYLIRCQLANKLVSWRATSDH